MLRAFRQSFSTGLLIPAGNAGDNERSKIVSQPVPASRYHGQPRIRQRYMGIGIRTPIGQRKANPTSSLSGALAQMFHAWQSPPIATGAKNLQGGVSSLTLPLESYPFLMAHFNSLLGHYTIIHKDV